MKRLTLIMAVAVLLCSCGHSSKNKQSAEEVQAAKLNSFVLPQASDTVLTRSLVSVPEEYNYLDFGLVVSYGGYDMDCALWPLHDGYWLVNSYYCLAQEDGKFVDPFAGQEHPTVHYSTVSFQTRNYNGECIEFYAAPDSEDVICTTDYKEITLHVIDADIKTRRLLVYSSPEDWCWGEPEDYFEEEYRHNFVELKGWVDEEWVCGSAFATCP